MTRSRLALFIAISILTLGAVLFAFFSRSESSAQVFPAKVTRDCAPWDGAAFTLSVPHESGVVIYVSIWQSPDIHFPRTLSFPDDTGQLGNAYILSELGPLEILRGRVTLQRVEVGTPIEGRFRFTSERGGKFEGRFLAEWDDQIILCG